MRKGVITGLVTLAILLSCSTKNSFIEPQQLLCEAKKNPIGLATVQPRFSWKNEFHANHSRQTAYQILVASSPELLKEESADLWDSGKVPDKKSIWVSYDGKALQSRSVGYWKVKVWDQNDTPSDWSDPQHFTVGLLEPGDWNGAYIAMDSNDSAAQSPFFRKTFRLDETYDHLFFHVNSLGYHELYINNQRVGDAVLAPAESQYDKRSFSLSYDVTPYLKKGKNAIVLWLGYGWYQHFKGRAHEGPLVRAQLDGLRDGEWHTLVQTDNSWTTHKSEYSILDNLLFGGEILNANHVVPDFADPDLDDSDWQQAAEIEVYDHRVTPQVVELNRYQEKIQPKKILNLENDVVVIDMGKNLTGHLTLDFPALPKGHQVTIQYADHLPTQNRELFELQSWDPEYTLEERENDRFDRQMDHYVSSGEAGTFTNKFNYRAFRYVRLLNMPQEIDNQSISARLIHTDFRETAGFACSEPLLNQIHDLFAYTLKCLTLGGKTVDCPHYERLGYGGDGNASTVTAQTLFDLSPLYTTWLTHWADCNKPDGDMPHTAPTFWSSGGGPYWCAFIIKASWQTWLNYGDKRVLETFYPVMLNWLKYVDKHSPNVLLEPWPNTENRNWYLGDWATPNGIDQTDPRSVGVVTNCAIVDSYDKLIKIARVLNRDSDAEKFAAKKATLSRAIHEAFYHPESATYGTGVQIDLAYPLILGVVPDSLEEKVTQSLIDETLENRNGHLATGLVGLPVLTHWVTTRHASNLMYEMMTKQTYPGFGFMLEHGATTVWEHWHGHRSRIHNCYNAPGSWFYQAIGGIRQLEEHPGYEQFLLAPRPPKDLTWAKVYKDTPYGTIRVEWQKQDGEMVMQVTVPTGSTAQFVLPQGVQNCKIDGKSIEPEPQGHIRIEAGKYQLTYNTR
ncbi:Bacterial alpha-L-rhamnosidase [candidate division KSB1 bacterium]|nr:Bacterial alpha-L-rhamnosidase [candidate division KSB1 bacterium]